MLPDTLSAFSYRRWSKQEAYATRLGPPFSGVCLTRTNVSTRLITKSENKQLGTALPALPGSESVGGAGKGADGRRQRPPSGRAATVVLLLTVELG